MVCSKCGNALEVGDMFCSKCGTKVDNGFVVKAPLMLDHIKELLTNFPWLIVVGYDNIEQ